MQSGAGREEVASFAEALKRPAPNGATSDARIEDADLRCLARAQVVVTSPTHWGLSDAGHYALKLEERGSHELLGRRVRARTGVVGRVIAISVDGRVDVSNENEGGRYSYWFDAAEVVEMDPPMPRPPEPIDPGEWTAGGEDPR